MSLTTVQPITASMPFSTCLARCGAMIRHSRAAQFFVFAIFSLAVRAPVLGSWNYDLDDEYYYVVGQRLLKGGVLYVDVWDRKGPLLYLFYALCGAISASPLTYQIAATLCAAGTGYFISRLAGHLTDLRPAILAGLAYCALLLQFGGENGQAPVIYNLLMSAAAYAIASRQQSLRQGRIDRAIVLAMFGAGCAVAVKQSAALEACFFTLVIARLLWRGDNPGRVTLVRMLLLAGTVALPMLATFAWYLMQGHLAQLWQALVTSNLDREYYSPSERLWYLMILAGRMSLSLAFAGWGAFTLLRLSGDDTEARFAARFVTMWALVSIVAVVAFPAVFLHYALPVLVPLTVLCSPIFARRGIGAVAWASMIVTALLLGSLPGTIRNFHELHTTDAFENYVRRESPSHRIFVWGVPTALYARLDRWPPTAILFAPHYYERSERKSFGSDVSGELRRVLNWRPEAVVVQDPLAMLDANTTTIQMMQRYLQRCTKVRRFQLADHLGQQTQWVYSGCNGDHASSPLLR